MNRLLDHYTNAIRPDLSEADAVRTISNGRAVDTRAARRLRKLNDHLLRDIGCFRHRWS